MYAERKQLTIRSLEVDLSFHREGERNIIERVVRLDADLTPEQRARFADIIERTPVTLTLKAAARSALSSRCRERKTGETQRCNIPE